MKSKLQHSSHGQISRVMETMESMEMATSLRIYVCKASSRLRRFLMVKFIVVQLLGFTQGYRAMLTLKAVSGN